MIRGGDWPSTVAGRVHASFRLALYPGEAREELRERGSRQTVAAPPRATPTSPSTRRVRYDGFACEGYASPRDEPLVDGAVGAHTSASRRRPRRPLIATTATTDARTFGLHGGIPASASARYAEDVHGVDERVHLPSVVQTAQVLALFIRDWCGVTG